MPEKNNDVYRTTDKENRHVNNREVLNPTPMQPPLGYTRPPSIMDTIREQIRGLRHLDDNDPETEEEADDFEIEEDPAMPSRWENDYVPSVKETRARLAQLEAEHEQLLQSLPPEGVQNAPPDEQPPHAPVIEENSKP